MRGVSWYQSGSGSGFKSNILDLRVFRGWHGVCSIGLYAAALTDLESGMVAAIECFMRSRKRLIGAKVAGMGNAKSY